MKKLVLSAFIASASFTSLLSTDVLAAGGHGPAGCGLGTEVVFRNADEWHEHVLAATTNGTSGNQTFGMTSGTLGCESANGPLKIGVALFLENNLDQLAQDTAIGEGETLSALTELVGVTDSDSMVFKTALKDNFDRLFSSETATSGEAYDALVSIMSEHEALAKYVG